MNECTVKVSVDTTINISIEGDVSYTVDEIQSLILLYLKLNDDNRKMLPHFLKGVIFSQELE